MKYVKSFKEWRAEEVVKLFLLKYEHPLEIKSYATPAFDFFIKSKNNSNIEFVAEVKSSLNFQSSFKKVKSIARTYEEAGMLNLAVIVFKVNDETEQGEFCLLTTKDNSDRYVLSEKPDFRIMNNQEFSKALNKISSWNKAREVA